MPRATLLPGFSSGLLTGGLLLLLTVHHSHTAIWLCTGSSTRSPRRGQNHNVNDVMTASESPATRSSLSARALKPGRSQ